MAIYIALFRGINVGGKNLLPMKELLVLLEGVGCKKVSTYIQSGNAVFEHDELPDKQIGALIEAQFGFKPEIIFLTDKELITAFEHSPYHSLEGKESHFYFCTSTPVLDNEKLSKLKSGSENYYLHGHVFYLHAPEGIGRSKLAANIERCLGTSATGRNLNTVNKLLGMIEKIYR